MSDIKTGDRVEIVVGGMWEGQRGMVVAERDGGWLEVRLDICKLYDFEPWEVRKIQAGPSDPPPPPSPNPFVAQATSAFYMATKFTGAEGDRWAAIGQGYALLALATKENQ